jgi:ribosomal-protein-alanine N-acetyltransferase
MVAKIDAAAFIPLWQNSQTLLEIAFRRAAIATIAEFDGKTVGYQISTGTIDGGHLARLAVNPVAQKNGVGTALLRDLMIQFKRRGARSLTVNTQSDNLPSLSLYQKAGFQLTGEKYAVFGFLIHS